jgi:hypothetical protein
MGLIVFGCTFAGALLGMQLRRIVPADQLGADSKETVNVGVGLIATMSALVLGLVTASAKSSFDSVDSTVKQSATQVLALDRTLARYGPETGAIRKDLHTVVRSRIENIWPQVSSTPAGQDPMRGGAMSRAEALADAVRGLKPVNDSQRKLQERALDLAESLLQARWFVFASAGESIPVPFLVVLLFWLTFAFVSFGLFAPRNATVVTVLFVCAVSFGSAVFLILEMDGPFEGMLKVSSDPLDFALARLNQ